MGGSTMTFTLAKFKAWTMMIWNVTTHMPCITIDFGYGIHLGDASFISSYPMLSSHYIQIPNLIFESYPNPENSTVDPRSSNSNVSFLDDMIHLAPPQRSSKTSRISRRAFLDSGVQSSRNPWRNLRNRNDLQILQMGVSENVGLIFPMK